MTVPRVVSIRRRPQGLFRRGRLLMVSPVHGDYRRCQAEIPLIVLFRFPGPALWHHQRNRQRYDRCRRAIAPHKACPRWHWLGSSMVTDVKKATITNVRLWASLRDACEIGQEVREVGSEAGSLRQFAT